MAALALAWVTAHASNRAGEIVITEGGDTSARAARPAGAEGGRVPRIAFSEYRLDNGLRVILAPDASAPVVAVCVTFRVGSFVEPRGRTGFAHLFEHMMFQGSKNLPKGAFDTVVVNNGGDDNGLTWPDRTAFYTVMPANQLEAALYVNADTIAHLNIDQENLDNQREVVKEERRRNVDNKPYGRLYETLLAHAYTNFAYAHPTIGAMADLDAATLDDVRRFYAAYYTPNNAVLTLSGDFSERDARAWIAQYFGPIPRGPEPAFPSLEEPPAAPSKERRVTLKDPLAPLPAWIAGWPIPPGDNADIPALEMLASVLGGGKSSRLWQTVVEQKGLATETRARAEVRRGPGLFTVSMEFGQGQDVSVAEAALDAEIARIRQEGVSEVEMRRARTRQRAATVAARRTAVDRALALGGAATVYGDPDRVNTEPDRLDAVTAPDVRRVAAKYLLPDRRTVVVDVPAPTREGGAR